MAMDNNISPYADNNIEGLRKGLADAVLRGEHISGRIIVYKDVPVHNPVLLEIRMGKRGTALVDTLHHYLAQKNSADAQVFRSVLDTVKMLAPAYSYALDIGSHATGWIPGWFDMNVPARTKAAVDPKWLTRTVADNGNGRNRMELSDFAAVIRDNEFEYIMFDACFMGGVESIYALRNKTRHIIASPAEVLIAGMPYSRIVGDLMAPQPRLREVCRKYYEYYQDRSAAIALYDCAGMEVLADAMRPIYQREIAAIGAMDPSEVQRFTSSLLKTVIFDLEDFVSRLMPDTDPLHTALRAALDQVVHYKNVTPMIMGTTPVDSVRFCGMATYIPADRMDAELTAAWMETEWAQAVVFSVL